MTDTKNVFNLGTHFITEKILPKIKKQVLERCILISYTNGYKEHTNRDTMKKVNKQCLLDTPRTVRVREKTCQVIVQTSRL